MRACSVLGRTAGRVRWTVGMRGCDGTVIRGCACGTGMHAAMTRRYGGVNTLCEQLGCCAGRSMGWPERMCVSVLGLYTVCRRAGSTMGRRSEHS